MKTNFARRLRRDQTDAERKLWSVLRNRQMAGFKFKRQVPKGPYIADFYCAEARLVIELDGGQHGESHAIVHDSKRTRFLEEGGFRVVRFWNGEVFDNLDGVLATIMAKLEEPPFP